MTNLLALAISIVATNTSELKTNVVETPHPPIPSDTIFISGGLMYYDEKWVTTTVEKVETLRFDWQGKTRELLNVTLVSSNTVHFRIKKEWEVVK